MFRQGSIACLLCVLIWCARAVPAADARSAAPATEAVLLSDPHFDPFRDPAKAARLNAAPITEWEAIFNEAASANAVTDFNKLQADCKEAGTDADHDLLLSSFDAAEQAQHRPAFVLVAGDLIVHRFDCRYRILFPKDADLERHASEFVEKVINYTVLQLRKRFPDTPVYVALGNNDTGCADYRLDADSEFLRRTSPAVSSGWIDTPKQEQALARRDYENFGSYALTLPSPMQRTRLLVLDDLFLSAEYKGTCAGTPNPATAKNLLAWTEKQLASAKQRGEKVWVLAHIPPGVNVYATYLHPRDLCHGQPPAMFLQSQTLADMLAKYATTVSVFISGHTHIDEMHLLGRDEQSPYRVPLKTVPSISPISKNPPSFLTASVDTGSAAVLDYTLHTASSATGKNITWTTAYSFDHVYGEQGFNAASLRDLFSRFTTNSTADQGAVQNYQEHAATGIRRIALQALWPQYICSMRHESAEKFTDCACQSAQPTPAQ